MLLKIFFTLGVIIIGILVIRHKGETRQLDDQAIPVIQKKVTNKPPLIRILLAMVIAIMLLGGTAFVYYEWSWFQQTMIVTVVNSNDAKETIYHARQGDINAQMRYFVTLDGRKITLSNIERLEFSPLMP